MSEKMVEASDFVKQAIALRVKLNRIGSRRAVDTSEVDLGGADEELIRVSKEILDSEELAAIRNHDLETRAAVRQRALPSFLGSGWYLIPKASVASVDAYIAERAESREALVEKLVEALPVLKERSEARLKHLWNEEQFPSGDTVRDKTKVATKWVTFDVPASLKGISQAILDREVRKAQVEASAARDAAVALLRDEMKKLVDTLANAFIPGPSGRKRGLRKDTLDRVNAALALFEERNIAQDGRLSEFVNEAKALIAGRDAKALRSDSAVASGFEKIRENLSKVIEDGPSRVIDFEE